MLAAGSIEIGTRNERKSGTRNEVVEVERRSEGGIEEARG